MTGTVKISAPSVVETLAVTSVGIVLRPGIELKGAGLGHNQDVAKIGMPRTAQMGMAEADYGIVGILVAGAIVICPGLVLSRHVMGNGVGIRRELDGTERSAGSGETMAHAGRTDHRIDITGNLCSCRQRNAEQEHHI